MEESERRAQLRGLDELLDALEQLNLKDTRSLPDGVRKDLQKVGVELEPGDDITGLIEKVWIQQEKFLGATAPGGEAPGGVPQRGASRAG
ncbi:MAG: hypothetical protein QOE92_956 [Chloroflexota bacterium]|jgi:hypothetical protein|nr:hypothetical protein [Chloroflexota bacterium]